MDSHVHFVRADSPASSSTTHGDEPDEAKGKDTGGHRTTKKPIRTTTKKKPNSNGLRTTIKPESSNTAAQANPPTHGGHNKTISNENNTDSGNSTFWGTQMVEFLEAPLALPMWAFIVMGAAGLVLIIMACICLIRGCCRKKKKKTKTPGKKAPKDTDKLLTSREIKTDDSEDEGSILSTSYLGRLQYSIEYDMQKRELLVGVLQAADLPALDDSGTSDPYVKVCLLPNRKKKHKTKVLSKTLNPVFNETFTFKLPYEDIPSRTLAFAIYDFDRFTKDEQMGHVQVSLANLQLETGNPVENWGDIKDPIEDEENIILGDICISLHYVPASERLSIGVLECKTLRKVHSEHAPNPYVKMDLQKDGKRIKKKKTSTKESTINPYFNEVIVFDVPKEQIYHVSLTITVIHTGKRVRTSEALGCIFLGKNSSGTEERHWNDMLANPRRPMVQWHPLQEMPE